MIFDRPQWYVTLDAVDWRFASWWSYVSTAKSGRAKCECVLYNWIKGKERYIKSVNEKGTNKAKQRKIDKIYFGHASCPSTERVEFLRCVSIANSSERFTSTRVEVGGVNRAESPLKKKRITIIKIVFISFYFTIVLYSRWPRILWSARNDVHRYVVIKIRIWV